MRIILTQTLSALTTCDNDDEKDYLDHHVDHENHNRNDHESGEHPVN